MRGVIIVSRSCHAAPWQRVSRDTRCVVHVIGLFRDATRTQQDQHAYAVTEQSHSGLSSHIRSGFTGILITIITMK